MHFKCWSTLYENVRWIMCSKCVQLLQGIFSNFHNALGNNCTNNSRQSCQLKESHCNKDLNTVIIFSCDMHTGLILGQFGGTVTCWTCARRLGANYFFLSHVYMCRQKKRQVKRASSTRWPHILALITRGSSLATHGLKL